MVSTPGPVRNSAGSVRAAGLRQAGAADLITKSDLQTFLTAKPPYISLHLPTHRVGSERDPILWKNLLGEVQERLMARGMRRPTASALLGPARKLLEGRAYWGGVSNGPYLGPLYRQAQTSVRTAPVPAASGVSS